MAVEDFAKTKSTEDSDDDDMPLVLKRSSAASKSNHSNSSSQKHDVQVGRQVSNLRSPNGQISSPQMVETVTSVNAFPAVSPLASPKASLSSGMTSKKISLPNSRPSASDQSQNINQHKSNTVAKEVKPTVQPKLEPNDDAEDSEDDKPLSTRLCSGLSKSNSNHAIELEAPGTSESVEIFGALKPEDSDDEIPLASRFQLKSNTVASTSKSYDSAEVTPLGTKIQQNGSASTAISSKRPPPGEVKSTVQASVKKPRISDVSIPVNSKHSSVKTETNSVIPQVAGEKTEAIRSFQKGGSVVALVGDEVNDSPALAAADVGMVIGAGTDIAIEATEYVLMRSNLEDIITALDLPRKKFAWIRWNYIFAMAYNVIAIPVAAGFFFPLLRLELPPWVAGACMAMSPVCVVCSFLYLKRYKKPRLTTILEMTIE